MANRKVKAELEIDGKDNTSPAFRSVAARMGQVERQIARFNRTAEAFNSRIGQIQRTTAGYNRVAGQLEQTTTMLGASLKAFGAYAVTSGLQTAIVDFAAMERRMNRIGTTADASADDTREAFEIVQKAAKDMALPIDQGVQGLETLVASGMSLKEALAFLPSVLMATQASGAAAEDIANTALKSASALKLEASQMSNAFDLMVTSGKSGQFELRDMSQYIPGLANSFASLGYSGEEGLKRLLSVLQTLREDTGSAENAATQAGEIFGKIYAPNTVTQFKKLGIDLRRELDKAEKSGEDVLSAFVRLSREALKGDLKRLPELFGDKEFRQGMQSLLSSPEALARYLAILNGTKVKGSAMKDAQRMIDDTQGRLDRLGASWDGFMNSLGGAAAPVAIPALDLLSKTLDHVSERTGTVFDEVDAIQKMTPEERITHRAQFQHEYERLNPEATTAQRNEAYHQALVKYGRQPGGRWADILAGMPRDRMLEDYVNQRIPQSTGRPGSASRGRPAGGIPIPIPRPYAHGNEASYPSRGDYSALLNSVPVPPDGSVSVRPGQTTAELASVLDNLTKLERSGGDTLRLAGEDAGRAIIDGAGELDGVGQGFISALRSVVGDFRQAVRELAATKVEIRNVNSAGAAIGGMVGGGQPPLVRGNLGRSMPDHTNRPKSPDGSHLIPPHLR